MTYFNAYADELIKIAWEPRVDSPEISIYRRDYPPGPGTKHRAHIFTKRQCALVDESEAWSKKHVKGDDLDRVEAEMEYEDRHSGDDVYQKKRLFGLLQPKQVTVYYHRDEPSTRDAIGRQLESQRYRLVSRRVG